MGRGRKQLARVTRATRAATVDIAGTLSWPAEDDFARAPDPLRHGQSRAPLKRTLQDYAAAMRRADGGDLELLADFAEWTIDDGRVWGAYEQATSMLGVAARFECEPTLAAVLATDFPRLFPEAEQTMLWIWGFHLGIGFARVTTTWDSDGIVTQTVATWHPRWFSRRREVNECGAMVDRWYVRTEQGSVPVDPADGWIIFAPYGMDDPHRKGLLKRLALPVLSKAGAVIDRNRTGEVTPVLVMTTQGLTEGQRKTALAEMRLARDSRMVLPARCDLKVVDASSGTRAGTFKDAIEDAKEEIAGVILGQSVTMDGSSGFSNGDVQESAQDKIARKREQPWSTTLGKQLVTPYAVFHYGYAGDAIYPRWIEPIAPGAAATSPGAAAPAGPPPSAGATPPVATPAIPPTSDVVGAAAELDDSPDETVDAYARDLTEAESRTCEHGRVNACAACGVERVRAIRRDEEGAIVRDKDGNAMHAIAWRPLRRAAARTAYAPSMTLARRAPMHVRTVVLAALGDEPPTEFLIFAWGENESSKGSVWMDRADADAIVAEMGSRDVMIDLEHLSIPEIAGDHYDPDARGAGKLRIDDVGLWCSDIRWTADGARRIRSKTQRYTSPAFDTKADAQGREHPTRLFNVALCANPATRYITPLVAASATATARHPAHSRARGTMDDATFIAFVRSLFGAAPDQPLEELAATVAASAPPKQAPAPDVMPPDGEAMTEEDPAAPPVAASRGNAAPTAVLSRLGVRTDGEAVAAIDALMAGAKDGAKALALLTEMTKANEDKERAEIFRVHAAKFSPEARKDYATRPIGELRAFVRFASPIGSAAQIVAPNRAPSTTLSQREQDYCARNKIDPKAFAEKRALMNTRAPAAQEG